MVEQGKRQLLYAPTKGELRTGGEAPSLKQRGRSHSPNGKSASDFVGELIGGDRRWAVIKESWCHG